MAMAKTHRPSSSFTRHGPTNGLPASLLKLSEACPFDQTNPEDCPLFTLRKMRPKNRSQWLSALTEDDLEFLAAYHRVCLHLKHAS
jgi:hypothetical protein